MTAQGQPDALPELPDILAHLSPEDALAVLRSLARDEDLAPRIRQVATAHLQTDAPRDEHDVQAIAEEVRRELAQLEIEEAWDRAGPKRHGYVDPGEAADEMMDQVLEPYLGEMRRYQRLGMGQEAAYLCMGLIAGLYRFDHESQTEFKALATDLPCGHAEFALGEWLDGQPAPDLVKAMHAFITDALYRWELPLLRSLDN
jgi:hypothetical protein